MRSLLAAGLLLVLAPTAFAGSDVPPEGPPWVRDLVTAQTKALERGVPIFAYFTKTY